MRERINLLVQYLFLESDMLHWMLYRTLLSTSLLLIRDFQICVSVYEPQIFQLLCPLSRQHVTAY
jgi:hypothetical protein